MANTFDSLWQKEENINNEIDHWFGLVGEGALGEGAKAHPRLEGFVSTYTIETLGPERANSTRVARTEVNLEQLIALWGPYSRVWVIW